MTTIQENIEQYRQSCALIRVRIDELSKLIASADTQRDKESAGDLQGRRYRLYCQLAEMERSLHELREYVDLVETRRMAKTMAAGL